MADEPTAWNPGHEVVRASPRVSPAQREVFFEPFLWGLFSAGGFITAFLLPVTILFLSFSVTLGLWPPDRLAYDAFAERFGDPLVRLFFLVLIGGSLFHGMHRLKHTLVDIGVRRAEPLLNVILYGIAILGTLAALYYTFFFGVPLPWT